MNELYWFESLVSIINIHLILSNLMSIEFRKKLSLVIFLLVLLPLWILSFFSLTNFNGLLSGILVLLNIFIPVITIKNVKKSHIFYVSLFYIGFSSLLIMSSYWIANAFHSEKIVLIIINVFINLSLLCVCLLISKKVILPNIFYQILFIPKNLKIVLLIVLWTCLTLEQALIELLNFFPRNSALILTQILSAVLFVLLGVMCPMLITGSFSSMFYRRVSEDLEKQVDEQIKHYNHIYQANDNIRRFKHDFKNLVVVLKNALYKNNTAEALECLNDFNKTVYPDYILFETGNFVADALLTEKQQEAFKINTKIVFNGQIPNNAIAATDVCIILGNALDNALEACTKLKSKCIKSIAIDCYTNNGFLFIAIQNPTDRDIRIYNGEIPTSKKDRENHGIGLYSIKNALKKYSGDLDFSSKDCIFITKISLYLKNGSENIS